MGNLLYRFILAVAIAAIAVYVAVLNAQPATLTFGPGMQITTSIGILFLATFVAGCVIAGTMGLYYAVKWYLRERRLRRSLGLKDKLLASVSIARSLRAQGDLALAEAELERLLKKMPEEDLISLELAETKKLRGNSAGSIAVLEECRKRGVESAEVYLSLADSLAALGNNSAALDNIELALKIEQNSPVMLEKGCHLAIAFGQLKKALHFAKQLESFGSKRNSLPALLCRYTVESNRANSLEIQETALRSFIKEYPQSGEGYQALSEVLAAQHKLIESSEHLAKSARLLKNGDIAYEAALRFMNLQQPQKAFSSLKAFASECTDIGMKVAAYTALTDICIRSNMLTEATNFAEEAKTLCAQILDTEKRELTRFRILQRLASLQMRMGNVRAAADLWVINPETKLLPEHGSAQNSDPQKGWNKTIESVVNPEFSTP